MTEVRNLLIKLAAELDAPGGPGSGAVCLDAATVIDQLRQQLQPPSGEATD